MAVVSYSQGRGVARWAVTACGLLVVSGLALDRVLDPQRNGRSAIGRSGYDAPANHRRSHEAVVRYGSAGCHLRDGAGGNRIAAGRRRELPGRRAVSAVGALVGDFVDLATISVLVCGARQRAAPAGRKHLERLGWRRRNEFQRFRHECGGRSDLQLRAPTALHALGRIRAGISKRFGHLEDGSGHGRLMKTMR
jgi:hypothetical protein